MSDLAAHRLAAWVGIGREQAADFISDQIAPAIRKQERERVREALDHSEGLMAIIADEYGPGDSYLLDTIFAALEDSDV